MMSPEVSVSEGQPIASFTRLQGWLLLVWFLGSFGIVFFARDLRHVLYGWPVSYWFAAQGSLLIFILIVAIYARLANRAEGDTGVVDPGFARYTRRIHKRFFVFVVLFLLFVLALGL